MTIRWEPERSAAFLDGLRADIAHYGDPLVANVTLDELTPDNVLIAGTAGLIITEDEHLIFIRRSQWAAGDWLMTPGGELEFDERPSEGFIREAREETGLDVEIDTLVILFATDGAYVPGYAPGELGVWVQFIAYARGGRLNDCEGREDEVEEAVAIRCDEVDPARIWLLTDRILLHYTACGPPEITRDDLLAQFNRLNRRWPPRLDEDDGR